MVIAGLLLGAASCDQGTPDDERPTGPPVHLVSSTATVVPGQPLELAFDRFLLPLSITRQTFFLQDLSPNAPAFTPAVSYDPVARVVTIVPDRMLSVGQTVRVTILAPKGRSDANGLRAIDGAGLDPSASSTVVFTVASGNAPAAPPSPDFCGTILPIFQGSCAGSNCHSGAAASALPASGLLLSSADGVTHTAIGRAAQGSNTGPLSGSGTAPQAPPLFGVDMPIIDNNSPADGPGGAGDPGNSWLLYKLLMATTNGAPTIQAHAVTPAAVTASERAILANWIPGREMPFPTDPAAPLEANPSALTGDQLVNIELWIAQGASVMECN